MMNRLICCLGLLVVLSAGCAEVDVNPPRKPRPIPADAIRPRSEISMVVITSEPVASDADRDGVLDSLDVTCYLFNADRTLPCMGKGAFRFELFDSEEPADRRVPFQQINIPFQENRRHAQRSRYGQVIYTFRLPLGRVPAGLRQLVVRARFFPEDGQPEAAFGSAPEIYLGRSPGPRVNDTTIGPRIHHPATRPDTGRPIVIRPRATQPG